jgi:hypothetical protein
MARHAYDPREVITGAVTAPLRQVVAAIAVAALVTPLFGSAALLAWAEALPVGPFGDAVLELAVRWHGWMSAIGLDQPYTVLRRVFTAFRSWRW